MKHARSSLVRSGAGPNGLVCGGTWNVYPQTLCLGEYWPFAALENRGRGGLYRSALQDLLQDRKNNDESQFEASAVASGTAWLPECPAPSSFTSVIFGGDAGVSQFDENYGPMAASRVNIALLRWESDRFTSTSSSILC